MTYRFLTWFWRTLRARNGLYRLIAFTLIGSALFILIGTLGKSVRDVGIGQSWRIVVFGFFMGVYLWQRARRWFIRLFLALVIGVILLLMDQGGGFLPLWSVVSAGFQVIIRGIVQDPAFGLAQEQLGQAWGMLQATLLAAVQDVNAWLYGALHGRLVYVPMAVSAGWHALFYILAIWMSWSFLGRLSAIFTMLPGGVLLFLVNAYRWNESVYPLAAYLAVLLLLSALSELHQHEERWRIQKLGYSEEIRSDFAAITLALVVLITASASVLPKLPTGRLADLALGENSASQGSGDPLAEAVGIGGEGAATLTLSGLALENLPRSHLLGSGLELSQQPVMSVRPVNFQADDIYKPYWRGLVYDIYTGQGWETSPLQEDPYRRGERVVTPWQPAASLLRVEITPEKAQIYSNPSKAVQSDETPDRTLLFSPGEIEQVNRRFWLSSRTAPGQAWDIFGGQLEVTFDGTKAEPDSGVPLPYLVDSWVPFTKESQLAGVEEVAPVWITRRYLQLPVDFPQEVTALAQEITTQGTVNGTPIAGVQVDLNSTQYEKVRALETYLRTFPYSLDLEPPPSEKDLASYFLFEIRTGYCDYYATAMVVMARAVGFPARLVVGYASGAFDPQQEAYLVTEANAHSWAEIYFTDVGWIPFEPTAVYTQFAYSDAPQITSTDLPALEPMIPAWNQELPGMIRLWGMRFLWALLGCLGLGLAAVGVIEWRWSKEPPDKMLAVVIRRVARWAGRQDVVIPTGRTPYEFFSKVAAFLQAKHPEASPLLKELADLYVQVKYSRRDFSRQDRIKTQRIWLRLRWTLWIAGIQGAISRRWNRLFVRRMDEPLE